MNELYLTELEKERVVEVLCELDPTRHGLPPELRQWKRHTVAQPMWIYRLRPAEDLPTYEKKRPAQVYRAYARDVSPGGVGLLSKIEFKVNDRFILPVHFAEGGGKLFLCEVVGVRKAPQVFWSIGARFIDSVEESTERPQIPERWLAQGEPE